MASGTRGGAGCNDDAPPGTVGQCVLGRRLGLLGRWVATAGCTQGRSGPVAPPPEPAHQAQPSRAERTERRPRRRPPSRPSPRWSGPACNGDLQCGTLVVPLDYAHPDGPTIPIAVARHPAEDPAARIGSLVIDPGGPGVSGIDDMANELELADAAAARRLRHRAVRPPRRRAQRPGHLRAAPRAARRRTRRRPRRAEQAATIAGLEQFAAACEKNSPNVLPYVGTVDVARDMDRLRQALGDSGLTYMGQSYGTLLGLTYASLFPTHIRAMVLDSVIDPALSFDQITQGQAVGFENMLNAFFTWCAGSASCPWRPAGDPTTALLALLATAATSPAPAGGGDLAGVGQLYDGVARCALLPVGLAAARRGAGRRRRRQRRARSSPSRRTTTPAAPPTPTTRPRPSTASTIPCRATWPRTARWPTALKASAPVFGPLLAWGEAGCAVWPVPPTRTVGPVAAPGAPPILVVGTTNDPATPYAWAVSVAKELDRGVLLTHDGDDHVAYFYSACVRADVQTYLVSGQTPPPGTTCRS